MSSNFVSLMHVSILAIAMSALAACSTGKAIDEGVPQAAYPEAPDPLPAPVQPGTQTAMAPETTATTRTEPLFEGSGQVNRTGQYPNINVQPRGATTQMGTTEAANRMQQMQALSRALADGRISMAQYQRRLVELRKLAATHSQDTIEKIEN